MRERFGDNVFRDGDGVRGGGGDDAIESFLKEKFL